MNKSGSRISLFLTLLAILGLAAVCCLGSIYVVSFNYDGDAVTPTTPVPSGEEVVDVQYNIRVEAGIDFNNAFVSETLRRKGYAEGTYVVVSPTPEQKAFKMDLEQGKVFFIPTNYSKTIFEGLPPEAAQRAVFLKLLDDPSGGDVILDVASITLDNASDYIQGAVSSRAPFANEADYAVISSWSSLVLTDKIFEDRQHERETIVAMNEKNMTTLERVVFAFAGAEAVDDATRNTATGVLGAGIAGAVVVVCLTILVLRFKGGSNGSA